MMYSKSDHSRWTTGDVEKGSSWEAAMETMRYGQAARLYEARD